MTGTKSRSARIIIKACGFGEPALNEFLRRYARKTDKMGGAKTFLAIGGAGNQTILAYYSLSPASIAYARTRELVRRGLARLAWISKCKGMGLAGSLCCQLVNDVCWHPRKWGEFATFIEARNARVAAWLASYGALPLLDAPLSLLLPLTTIAAALQAA